jgi:hypothetical protein
MVRAQRTDSEEKGVLLVHHTKSSRLRRVPLPGDLLREIRGKVGRLIPFSSSGQFNNAVGRLSDDAVLLEAREIEDGTNRSSGASSASGLVLAHSANSATLKRLQ